MRAIRYTLRVMVPYEIDGDMVADVVVAACTHDVDIDSKIRRWLGPALEEAEDAVNAHLPEGWYCKVEEEIHA